MNPISRSTTAQPVSKSVGSDAAEVPDLVIEISDSLVDDSPSQQLAESDTASKPISSAEMERIPIPWRHPFQATAWLARAGLGIVSLVLVLALLAAVPIVNFVVLGYLLEAEGRVARTGRLRQAFPLLGRAPQIGSIVLGVWIWILPLRLLADMTIDARLIDPTSESTKFLATVTRGFAVVVAIHLLLALARGGGFWTFLRPIKNIRWMIARLREGDYLDRAASAIRAFVADLRLHHHFSLGIRGFIVAFIWLVLPTALFAAADKTEGGPFLVTVIGGLWLFAVFCWLPFLQARYAAEDRFRAGFELRTIRQLSGRAPFSWLLAVVLVYLLALPLYLLKIALVPNDAMWFITLVFLMSMFPARIVTGWAYSRAARTEHPARFVWRLSARILMVPLVGLYVFLLFFTQFIGEHGKRVLFEHHAFMLPVPF